MSRRWSTRNVLLAAATSLLASFLLYAAGMSASSSARGSCGGGLGCIGVGLDAAAPFLVGAFLALIAAILLGTVGLVLWVVSKHREQVAARDVRRLELEVTRLERELDERT